MRFNIDIKHPMPKIAFPIKHAHPTAGIGKRKGRINSRAIIIARIILPLVSAVMKANIKIVRTTILIIKRYGFFIILP